jgi:hypothetical protein
MGMTNQEREKQRQSEYAKAKDALSRLQISLFRNSNGNKKNKDSKMGMLRDSMSNSMFINNHSAHTTTQQSRNPKLNSPSVNSFIALNQVSNSNIRAQEKDSSLMKILNENNYN